MDTGKRRQLIERVEDLGGIDWENPSPVVSLEEFFLGNDDPGSIGCNLSEHPGLGEFFRQLRALRERADVQDILIEVSEVEPDDETMWPFSDRLYVLTSASPEMVETWLGPLQPSEVSEGWANGRHASAPEPGPGYRVVAAWWD